VLFDALGRRGSLRLLWELREGRSLTFRGLVAACDSNPGALNARLKELRELRLVGHNGSGYHLTELGLGLVDALAPLNSWTTTWAQALEAGQARSGAAAYEWQEDLVEDVDQHLVGDRGDAAHRVLGS